MEVTLFFLRWIHFLAGVTWIGILYYFNFVQTPFFAETEAGVRIGAIQNWSRALCGGFAGPRCSLSWPAFHLWVEMRRGGSGQFYSSTYGVAISLGGLIGTMMFLNVWLVIWPKQQIVIASANQVAGGGQALPAAAGAGRRGALASRTNVVFSIPMLFFMGAAGHYTSLVGQSSNRGLFWLLVIIILAALEYNSLVGTQGATKKPLDSVSGALSGFILTAVFYVLALGLLS
jgi:uncharacterized membrane protein